MTDSVSLLQRYHPATAGGSWILTRLVGIGAARMNYLRKTQCIADSGIPGSKHREELWIYLECPTPTKQSHIRIQVTIYVNPKIHNKLSQPTTSTSTRTTPHTHTTAIPVPPSHYPPRSSSYIHTPRTTDHRPGHIPHHAASHSTRPRSRRPNGPQAADTRPAKVLATPVDTWNTSVAHCANTLLQPVSFEQDKTTGRTTHNFGLHDTEDEALVSDTLCGR